MPGTLSAQVRISEFVYDAPGSDDKHEWVELFNGGTTSVDISKWKINDGSNHVLNMPPKNGSIGSTVIASGAYVILADDVATFVADNPQVSNVMDTSLSLPNSGGNIKLLDASGKVEDSATYAKSKAPGDGNSVQLNSSGTWIAAAPTPGAVNAEVERKVVKSVEPKKTTTKIATTKKKTAAMPDVLPQEPEITSPQEEVAQESAQIAAAAPTSSSAPWYWGVAGIIGAAAAAGFVSKRKKSEEWEIIEETD